MSSLPPFLSTKKIVYPSRKANEIPVFVTDTKIKFDFQVRVVESFPEKTENATKPPDPVTGPIIDDTRKPHPHGYGQPLELILGKKFKIAAWETCLQTMRVGEVASFVFPPHEVLDYPFVSKQLRDISKGSASGHHHHASPMCGGMAAAVGLGYAELDPLMKEPKPLMITFELLSVTPPDGYEKDSWQLAAEEKLISIAALREKGNEHFKNGSPADACTAYGEALSRLEDIMVMEKPGEPEYIELEEKKVPLYLNIAQCKLNSKEYYQAIQAVNEVFDICKGPSRQKALFRRAKAHMHVWNFEEARKDLDTLATEFPGSRNLVEAELRNLKVLQKTAIVETDSGLKNAFVVS